MSESCETYSLNSSYDDDINTVVTSKGDCSTDSVFETVASYFDCGVSGLRNSSLSKVRFAPRVDVAPELKYSMTPPTKEELWYTNEEYDRFEAQYDDQMSNLSKKLNSPIIGKSNNDPQYKANVTKFEFIETYQEDIGKTLHQKKMLSHHPENRVIKLIRLPKKEKIRQIRGTGDDLFEL